MASFEQNMALLRNAAKANQNIKAVAPPRQKGSKPVSDDPYRRTPHGVWAALDLLNRFQYPVANTLRRLTDPDVHYSAKDYLKGIGKGFIGTERSMTVDSLENLGWRPYTKKGKLARAAVGLAGDILTDPLTYVSPFGLTKAGKLAEAGKLIKIGDEIVDMSKAANAAKVLDKLQDGMKAAGMAEDAIAAATKGYKGVKSAGWTAKLAEDLTKYGTNAELVKLAPTWGKQYKAGQRALLNFEVPRIIPGVGGYSTPVRVPGLKQAKGEGNIVGQTLANAATYANRRLQAGRNLANKKLWAAMPEASKAQQTAAIEHNLFKIGDTYYDLGSEVQRGKVRGQLAAQLEKMEVGQDVIDEAKKLFDGMPHDATGFADVAEEAFKKYGAAGERATLKGMRNRRVAVRFGKGMKPAGAFVNTMADAFNIIPEQVKWLRRKAEGQTTRASNAATEEIITSLGGEKNAENILRGGLPKRGYVDIIDDTGNVIKTVPEKSIKTQLRRLKKKGYANPRVKEIYGTTIRNGKEVPMTLKEAELIRQDYVEALAHPAVHKELEKIAATRDLTDDDMLKALDILDAEKNAGTEWGQGLRNMAVEEGHAAPMYGLPQGDLARIRKMAKEMPANDAWNASNALYNSERIGIGTGAIDEATAVNRALGESKGYGPHVKEMTEEEKLLGEGAGKFGQDEVRRFRNRSLYSSYKGDVEPDAAKYFSDNAEKIVAYTPDGKPVYGKDFLNRNWRAGMDDVSKVETQIKHTTERLAKSEEKALQEQLKVNQMKNTLPEQAARRTETKFQKTVSNKAAKLEKVNADIKQYQNKIANVEKSVKTNEEAAAFAEDYVNQLRADLMADGNKSQVLKRKLADAEKELQTVQADLARRQSELTTLQEGLKAAEAEGAQLHSEILRIGDFGDNAAELDHVVQAWQANEAKIAEYTNSLQAKEVPKRLLNRRARLQEEYKAIQKKIKFGRKEGAYALAKEAAEAEGRNLEDQMAALEKQIAAESFTKEEGIRLASQNAEDLKKNIEDIKAQQADMPEGAKRWVNRRENDVDRALERAARDEAEAGRLKNYVQDTLETRKEKHSQALDDAALLRDKKVGESVQKAEAQVRMAQSRADVYKEIAEGNRATLRQLEETRDKLLKEAERLSTSGAKATFDTDLFKNVLNQNRQTFNTLQKKITLQSLLDYCPDVPKDGTVPYGFVRPKDALPQGLLGRVAKTGEDMMEYEGLVKTLGGEELLAKLNGKMIPNTMVAPLNALLSPESKASNLFLTAHDWVLGILKPFMLSAPGTQVRNNVSSFLMAWAAGDFAKPRGWLNFAKSAGWNLAKKDANITIDGVDYKLSELWNMLENYGGTEMSRTLNEYLRRPELAKRNAFIKGAEWFTEKFNKPMSTVAEKTEATYRFAHFLNEVQNGATIEEAIESIARHFYDYGDLSAFEKNVMRRVMPFYTFWRKNMGANLYYLAHNTGYVSAPMKLANNLNTITEGDTDAIPLEWMENPRNQWLLKQGAYRAPWDGSKLLPLQGFLPQVDVAQFAPGELVDTAFGNLSPTIKTPTEIFMNKDTFTGRPIVTEERPTRYFLGRETDPRLIHLARPFRVLDLADRVAKELFPEAYEKHGYKMTKAKKEETIPQRIGSGAQTFVGVKAYKQDKAEVKENMLKALQNRRRSLAFRIKNNPKLAPAVKERLLADIHKIDQEIAKVRKVK
jgi:hypothetical protein